MTAAAVRDAVGPELVARVLANRKVFLKYQERKDGELVSAADPSLSPVDVVEDVADMMLEEMMLEQAAGEQWCRAVRDWLCWKACEEGVVLISTYLMCHFLVA